MWGWGSSERKSDQLYKLCTMVSQYLLIHSKTHKWLFYDPNLIHKGGSGVSLTSYPDSSHKDSQNRLFYDPSLTHGGGEEGGGGGREGRRQRVNLSGYPDSSHKVS